MPYQIARACPIDRDEMYAIFFERNFRPETYNAYSGKDVDKYANLVAAYTSDRVTWRYRRNFRCMPQPLKPMIMIEVLSITEVPGFQTAVNIFHLFTAYFECRDRSYRGGT